MQYLPPDVYQYMSIMNGNSLTASGIEQNMHGYLGTKGQYASGVAAAGTSTTQFYLVLTFPGGDFADRIDVHETLPMWVPASGTSPEILGVFSTEKIAREKMAEDLGNAYLVYKMSLKGRDGVMGLLEYMSDKGTLENPHSGR